MIHDTAVIDPSANLADNITVGAYAIIGADVSIGSNTHIGHHANIAGPTLIGENNRIFPHVSLGEEPQDIAYNGEVTQLIIGNNNIIREYVSMNRGTEKGGGTTAIGHDNFFMAYVHIGHDCIIGDNNTLTNSTSLAGHVQVGNQCSLGGFTLVHQFTHIGSFAFTSMGAVVNRDVPPFVIASGNYARSYGINKIGLQRKGFSKQTLSAITKAYKYLVRKRIDRESALAELQADADEFEEVRLFIDFINKSQRGIIK